MGYTPPEFAALVNETSQLNMTLSAIAKRYKPASLTRLLERVASEILKANVSGRKSQVDVFRLLHSELSLVNNHNNEENKKEAVQFLLGALMHRYQRINTEYTERPDTYLWSWFGSKPEDCRLYQAIGNVLQLSKENQLDALTMASCYKSFFENMKLGDRYKKYPHFAHDSSFFTHLRTMIKTSEEAAKPCYKQIEAIKFLISIATTLDGIRQTTEDSLNQLFKDFQSSFPLFENLSMDAIQRLVVEKITDLPVRQRIGQLLSIPYVIEHYSELGYIKFRQLMTECLNAQSQYALFGAYTVVLNRPEKMEQLEQTLKMALNCNQVNNLKIDNSAKLRGLNILQSWLLAQNDKLDLDYSTWGGNEEVFKAQIIEQRVNLIKIMELEEEHDNRSVLSH